MTSPSDNDDGRSRRVRSLSHAIDNMLKLVESEPTGSEPNGKHGRIITEPEGTHLPTLMPVGEHGVATAPSTEEFVTSLLNEEETVDDIAKAIQRYLPDLSLKRRNATEGDPWSSAWEATGSPGSLRAAKAALVMVSAASSHATTLAALHELWAATPKQSEQPTDKEAAIKVRARLLEGLSAFAVTSGIRDLMRDPAVSWFPAASKIVEACERRETELMELCRGVRRASGPPEHDARAYIDRMIEERGDG